MGSLQYRKKVVLQDVPPSPGVIRIVRGHFAYNVIWAGIGILSTIAALYFLGWKGVLASVIAIPPALLSGNTWVQILRKHPEWVQQNLRPFRVIKNARRFEPVLFWLGIVGAMTICGFTYLLANIPAEDSLASWVMSNEFAMEIIGLYVIMIGCAAIPKTLFLRKRMKEWTGKERISAKLAELFLQEYDNRKN